jgi:hypothetical protein
MTASWIKRPFARTRIRLERDAPERENPVRALRLE